MRLKKKSETKDELPEQTVMNVCGVIERADPLPFFFLSLLYIFFKYFYVIVSVGRLFVCCIVLTLELLLCTFRDKCSFSVW